MRQRKIHSYAAPCPMAAKHKVKLSNRVRWDRIYFEAEKLRKKYPSKDRIWEQIPRAQPKLKITKEQVTCPDCKAQQVENALFADRDEATYPLLILKPQVMMRPERLVLGSPMNLSKKGHA